MRDPTAPAIPEFFIGGGELAELMKKWNWRATPLGSPEGWPQSLRSMLRILLTSRYQMWMAWGPELTFFYNDAYRPTLGIKHPHALGRSAAEVWQEIWGDIGPLIERVLSTGQASYHERMLLLLERSGFPEETYHTFSYSPLFDDGGEVAGLFCVVMEETERVINERRLGTLRALSSTVAAAKTEGELFQAVHDRLEENLHDLPFTLTYLIDSDGATARRAASTGIEASHPAAGERLSLAHSPWPVRELLGSTPAGVVDLTPEFGDMPSGAWNKPAKQALVVPIPQPGHERSAAGFIVAGLNPYRALDDAYADFVTILAGQVASALASVRAFEEERRRAQALEEIDRAKTTFFSNVSHEFRTPLTLMLGPLEESLSRAEMLPPDERERVGVAHRNGLRLLKLVNTLLDFSRIEAGRYQATYEPVDLASFTAELASNFRSVMERAGLRFSVECDPLPQPVYVDRDMWEKVILNLLSNAFKFTFEGEIVVQTRISADGKHAEIVVRDTGIGIAANELSRLFERFRRIEGARGRSFEGSGIGLALVQELVKLHGGDIHVDSALGAGSTFAVRIPFGRAHLPADRIGAGRTESSTKLRAQAYVDEAGGWLRGSSPEAEAPPPASIDSLAPPIPVSGAEGQLVFVADDNADMRDYVQRLLRSAGFDVRVFADGEELLAACDSSVPHLVLSDVMMPRLDGFGVLAALRENPRLHDVPVLLLSARAGDEAKVEGLKSGADDYLIKPFSARDLIARVEANLKMAKLRKEREQAIRDEARRLDRQLASVRHGVAGIDGEIHDCRSPPNGAGRYRKRNRPCRRG
jgi:signal transduction histidine kinase/CheY-like chemotaxis protein